MMSDGFKVCTTCKISKSLEDFSSKKSSKDGKQNVCKDCAALHSRAHYENHKEKIIKRSKIRKERIRPILQKFVLSFLETGCVDCGEKDIIVLDFDHLENKKDNIATIIQSLVSLDILEEEISKCVVRCSNCHRKKTAKDFDWWRYKLSIK